MIPFAVWRDRILWSMTNARPLTGLYHKFMIALGVPLKIAAVFAQYSDNDRLKIRHQACLR
jgi:hypothetical protein